MKREGSPLPRISIPRWSRPAKHIQAEIERCWGLRVFVLDIIESSSEDTSIILAELLFYSDSYEMIEKAKWAEPESLFRGGLSEEELVVLACFLQSISGGPLSRLGWIHEALSWFERETSLTSDDGIHAVEQWNASSSAFLVRCSLRKGASFWLKAVHPAESAEYRITLTLESIFPGYLPRIVSSHAGWGAWLVEDRGPSAADDGPTKLEAIRSISRRLAELQGASMPHVTRLLDCGCSDSRLDHVRNQMAAALPILEEAMESQDIHGLPQLGRRRLEDLCEATIEVCDRLDTIGIPDTLIHNDLQLENIVGAEGGCRFIDWDQAGIGNPFLTFEQLRLQLPESGTASLVEGYRSWWARVLGPEAIDAGFASIAPVAIAVQLSRYVSSIPVGATLRRLEQRHLRSLARQLDTALQSVKRLKCRSA
jgi:hypothetical protein